MIQKMEFLSAIDGEEDTVNLLLIVSRKGHTYAHLFQWDVNTSLRHLSAHRAQRLHAEEETPLLLVPLIKDAKFMIISDKTISIWTDIALGPARRMRQSLNVLHEQPALFGNSRKQPLVTHWARPPRHETYMAEHDDLYICREDGVVQLLEIKPLNPREPVELIFHIGPLNGSLDSAFAILDTGQPGGDDLIVACGDMSDVGVYTIKARGTPVSQQALPNWSPILDFVAIRGPGDILSNNSNRSEPRHRPTRNRIFAISGRGDENGSVNELRYGLDARIALKDEQSEDSSIEYSSIVQLWALPDPEERVLYLLASSPWVSHLMHISSDGSDLDFGYTEDDTGFEFRNQTLATGSTPSGVAIQVTETSIRATVLVENGPRFVGDSLPDGTKVVAAAVRGESSLFAAVLQRGQQQSLYCGRVLLEENEITSQLAPALSLSKTATCLCIEVLGSTSYIILGSNDATIHVMSITETGMKPALERSINLELTDTENPVCSSLTVISTNSESHERVSLLCGLRSGNLVLFEIQISRGASGQDIGKSEWPLF
jgi:hypothetical protein